MIPFTGNWIGRIRSVPIVVSSLIAISVSSGQHEPLDPSRPITARVGMPVQLEQLVLPGERLDVSPIVAPQPPIVLRIVATYPHGNAHRYDLEFYGLDPGEYDLRNYLQRADGSPATALPPIPVRIEATLPSGHVVPQPLQSSPLPWLGGYRMLLTLAAIGWIVGLVWVLRGLRPQRTELRIVSPAQLSVADQLRPLVTAALGGTLAENERARLERLLLAFWCDRLGVTQQRPAAAIATLRNHPEAGVLMKYLEDWLHRPDPPEDIDLDRLLAPYQNGFDRSHQSLESA